MASKPARIGLSHAEESEELLVAPIDEHLLQEICRRILDVVPAEQIKLFGSHAYGTPNEDSDIDLLVVVDSQESVFSLCTRIHKRLSHRLVSLDIIVRTPDQISNALGDEFNPFLREAWAKGKVLYERVSAN